jgi:hypothetical protein
MPFLKQFSGIIFIVFFGCSQVFSQQAKESALLKKYSPAQLKQDAELMKNIVMSMHPGIGVYNSRGFYLNLFDTYIGSLKDSLNEKQFRIKTKIILDQLHCGHTEALLSRAYYKEAAKQTYNFSPYFFISFFHKLFPVFFAVQMKVVEKRRAFLNQISHELFLQFLYLVLHLYFHHYNYLKIIFGSYQVILVFNLLLYNFQALYFVP